MSWFEFFSVQVEKCASRQECRALVAIVERIILRNVDAQTLHRDTCKVEGRRLVGESNKIGYTGAPTCREQLRAYPREENHGLLAKARAGTESSSAGVASDGAASHT